VANAGVGLVLVMGALDAMVRRFVAATVDSVTTEIHEKRHRGPRALWPVGSFLAWNVHRLPHWASRFSNAVDRAVYDTTIIAGMDNPPPAGDREPRRPKPKGPVMSL
jgi:hypothetical protein